MKTSDGCSAEHKNKINRRNRRYDSSSKISLQCGIWTSLNITVCFRPWIPAVYAKKLNGNLLVLIKLAVSSRFIFQHITLRFASFAQLSVYVSLRETRENKLNGALVLYFFCVATVRVSRKCKPGRITYFVFVWHIDVKGWLEPSKTSKLFEELLLFKLCVPFSNQIEYSSKQPELISD